MTGPKLIAAMARKGHTIESLSERLGVSFDTVASWRTERRHPCCEYMIREIEKALRVRKK